MKWKILSPLGLMGFVVFYLLFGPMGTDNYCMGDTVSAPVAQYVWTAPEYGTPVHHYVVQILTNDIDTLTIDPVFVESVMVTVDYGNKYLVRVAAVDDAGVQGGYSLWAVPYTPELSPPEF